MTDPYKQPRILEMKQGDLRPVIESVLMSNGRDVIDLTGAEDTTYLVYSSMLTGTLYERNAIVENPSTDGKVKYQWVAGDTDVPGWYDLAWRSIDDSDRPMTVPNDSYDLLHILRAVPFGPTTFSLVRDLRSRLGDEDGDLYPDSEALALALKNGFGQMTGWLQVASTNLSLVADPDVDDDDPLICSRDLLFQEQALWVTSTAYAMLRAEHLKAARRAAILRANTVYRMDATKIADKIGDHLAIVEDELEEILANFHGARVADLTRLNRRFYTLGPLNYPSFTIPARHFSAKYPYFDGAA